MTVRQHKPTTRKPRKAGTKTSSRKTRTRKAKTSGPGYLGKSALGMFVYGPPGVGKTSFCGSFPGVAFIHDPQEPGIRDLVDYGQMPAPIAIWEAEDFEDLLGHISNAPDEDGVQTIVLDSMSGMQQLCFQFHCEEYFDGDWSSKGFLSYYAGPENATQVDWVRLLDALDRIRKKGINVITVAHSEVKNFSNPEGGDYERFVPAMDKRVWKMTHRWAQCVLFMNYHVDLDKTGLKNKPNADSETRFIYTQWSPAYEAKNRYGLPPLIDMGEDGKTAYTNFEEAMQK